MAPAMWRCRRWNLLDRSRHECSRWTNEKIGMGMMLLVMETAKVDPKLRKALQKTDALSVPTPQRENQNRQMQPSPPSVTRARPSKIWNERARSDLQHKSGRVHSPDPRTFP